jgi:hypothetical protein
MAEHYVVICIGYLNQHKNQYPATGRSYFAYPKNLFSHTNRQIVSYEYHLQPQSTSHGDPFQRPGHLQLPGDSHPHFHHLCALWKNVLLLPPDPINRNRTI